MNQWNKKFNTWTSLYIQLDFDKDVKLTRKGNILYKGCLTTGHEYSKKRLNLYLVPN